MTTGSTSARRLACRSSLVWIVCAFLLANECTGDAAREEQPPPFRATATAVVIDVVVRDVKNRPVTGLTASDFEVFDDDARQQITAFAAVVPVQASTPSVAGDRAMAPPPNSTQKPAEAVHKEMPPALALVFEQLGPIGARMASW